MNDIMSNISIHQESVEELKSQKVDLERKLDHFDRIAVLKIEASEKRQKRLKSQLTNEYDRKVHKLKDEYEDSLGEMESRHNQEMENLRTQLLNASDDFKAVIKKTEDAIAYHSKSTRHALHFKFGYSAEEFETRYEADPKTTVINNVILENEKDADG